MLELENICSFMLKKNEQKYLEKKEDNDRMEIENDEKEEDEDYIKNEIKKNYEDEKIIYIKFSSASKVTFSFSIFCKKTEYASKLKEILLKHNPDLRNRNIILKNNEIIVDENKTLEENKIKSNDQLIILETD